MRGCRRFSPPFPMESAHCHTGHPMLIPTTGDESLDAPEDEIDVLDRQPDGHARAFVRIGRRAVDDGLEPGCQGGIHGLANRPRGGDGIDG